MGRLDDGGDLRFEHRIAGDGAYPDYALKPATAVVASIMRSFAVLA